MGEEGGRGGDAGVPQPGENEAVGEAVSIGAGGGWGGTRGGCGSATAR